MPFLLLIYGKNSSSCKYTIYLPIRFTLTTLLSNKRKTL